jgi:hypothetical protein
MRWEMGVAPAMTKASRTLVLGCRDSGPRYDARPDQAGRRLGVHGGRVYQRSDYANQPGGTPRIMRSTGATVVATERHLSLNQLATLHARSCQAGTNPLNSPGQVLVSMLSCTEQGGGNTAMADVAGAQPGRLGSRPQEQAWHRPVRSLRLRRSWSSAKRSPGRHLPRSSTSQPIRAAGRPLQINLEASGHWPILNKRTSPRRSLRVSSRAAEPATARISIEYRNKEQPG